MSARSLVFSISLIALPFVLGTYEAWVLARVCLFAIAAFGLSLLFSHGGQLSLGQAGFLAVGAYGHVLLMRVGLGPILSLPIGVLLAAFAGLGLAALTQKARGVYLALSTFAFGVIVESILAHFDGLTGGRAGLSVPSQIFSAGTSPGLLLGLGLLGAAIAATVHRNLIAGAFGRGLRLMRDDEIAAAAIGMDVRSTRRTLFALSAGLTGAAGALMAHLADALHPGQFTLAESIELLLIVLLARGSTLGVLLASLFVVGSFHYLGDLGSHQPLVFGGLVLVAVFTIERSTRRWAT